MLCVIKGTFSMSTLKSLIKHLAFFHCVKGVYVGLLGLYVILMLGYRRSISPPVF